ncbi:MAG: hypothetical protein GPI92_23335 [Microcystis aeruginosa K13-06]|nr:hypothetical protein [Microcystis aeruginosa K13-06]
MSSRVERTCISPHPQQRTGGEGAGGGNLRTRCPKNGQLNFNGKSHALGDIGRTWELSLERMRQIESKALQKLRQSQRRNQIRDYFEALS